MDFRALRKERVAVGDHLSTIEAISSALGVAEKQIWQYEEAEKRVPLAILRAPRISAAFREMVAEMQLAASRDVARDTLSVVALGRAVVRLKAYTARAALSRDMRNALAATVWRFVDELTELAHELSEEPSE